MCPLSPAKLKINGIAIRSNVQHQLINAYTEPKYMWYLQRKNKWNNKTVHFIAWNCLNLGLKRINREVALVKICNDLLPTVITLQKWKWQARDSCCLCEQSETRDHMLRCQALSWRKWRIKTIATLRKQIKQLNTKYDLENTICCVIAEWFESGHVPLYKYPGKFNDEIWSQGTIGWRQIFNGRISKHWLDTK